MSQSDRYQDGNYAEKLYGLDGWVNQLIEKGRFSCRDVAIDHLVKDYEKRYLRNASPTEQFLVGAVATGLRLYMPESEVVQAVAGALWPLPRKWASKKAQKKIHATLNGLGVCSNVHLFGLDETMGRWGRDTEPEITLGGIAKDFFSSLFRTAASMKPRPRRRSVNMGPVTVSAHTRRTKSGRTVNVRVHTRRR